LGDNASGHPRWRHKRERIAITKAVSIYKHVWRQRYSHSATSLVIIVIVVVIGIITHVISISGNILVLTPSIIVIFIDHCI
jgi:hypothetical protein